MAKCRYPDCFNCEKPDCDYNELDTMDIIRQDMFDKALELELLPIEIIKRRQTQRKYNKTDKGKKRTKRYNNSAKGKERFKAYNQSEKGKERFKRYYEKKKMERLKGVV